MKKFWCKDIEYPSGNPPICDHYFMCLDRNDFEKQFREHLNLSTEHHDDKKAIELFNVEETDNWNEKLKHMYESLPNE